MLLLEFRSIYEIYYQGGIDMQLLKKCFVIPHKRKTEFPIVEKQIIESIDLPVEKIILKIMSRIYAEGRRAAS